MVYCWKDLIFELKGNPKGYYRYGAEFINVYKATFKEERLITKMSILSYMKKLSISFSLLILFTGYLKAQSKSSDANSFEVTLFSNGYTYPKSDDWHSNHISKQGLIKWSNANVFTRTFFYPQQPGKIQVGLKIKSSDGDSKLKVQLDSTGKSYEVSIKKSSDYVTSSCWRIFDQGCPLSLYSDKWNQ